MGYKNIMINQPLVLSIKNQQLFLTDHICVPLEDINCIMIENKKIKLSAYMLQQIADMGIAVYFCNEKHIPNGVILPMLRHSRHFKLLKNQISISKPLQKTLWKTIIKKKIENQGRCLEYMGINGYDSLYQMQKQVLSGDSSNVESKAAAYYFKKLFGKEFSRGDDNLINSCLNYCYAIIRGLIARSIICYGFEPAIGLFHHNELNSYNLADDFIETLRPFVDYYVASKFDLSEVEDELTPIKKKELFKALSLDMKIDDEKHVISNVIDKMIMSYGRSLNNNKDMLLLPDLIPLEVHRYE